MNWLKQDEGVPLLNFVGGSWCPTFKLWGGSRVPGSRDPGSWGPGPTFTARLIYQVMINWKNFTTSNLLDRGPKTPKRRSREAEISPSQSTILNKEYSVMIGQENFQQWPKRTNCKQLRKTGQCSLECHNYSTIHPYLWQSFSLTQKPSPNIAVKNIFS